MPVAAWRGYNEGRPMSLSRTFASLATIFIATVESPSIDADAATLSLVGSSTKVCQLTGDTDWATNQPTAAQTLSNFGLDAVDLGFPVDSGSGPLYFLFGDALPVTHLPFSTEPPDDALGWTTRTTKPDNKSCLDLQLAISAPKIFAHPTVTPPIRQGTFNVPSGGIIVGNAFYAFFWTDHCVPGQACPETSMFNTIGRSAFARAFTADPTTFYQPPAPHQPWPFLEPTVGMPSGFVYVSAARPAPGMVPNPGQPSIPVFGVPRYRASIPYMALAPSATFGDPATWSFYAGGVGGQPKWLSRKQWESKRISLDQWTPPAGAEIFDANPSSERCVGEHSVTWNAPLHSWLLLYGCAIGPFASRIEARTAPDPWGPWSPPTVVLSQEGNPGLLCTLLQKAAGCPNLRNYWWLTNEKKWPGYLYAPFVMERFTVDATPEGVGQPRQATIYWLLSTWNPYVVTVMQSKLKLE
jgi:hypothetical protein